jgi:hypothetical protein
MNKGKGAVNVLIFLAGLIGAIIGFFKWSSWLTMRSFSWQLKISKVWFVS